MIRPLLGVAAAIATTATGHAQILTGWSDVDARRELAAAGYPEIHDTTADPRFPSVQAYTPEGFSISIARMACAGNPTLPATRCSGAWVTVAIPATTEHWAENIVGSLERFGQNPVGVNTALSPIVGPDGNDGFAVLHSAYVVSDGGVAEGLLTDHIEMLMNVSVQTRDFLLSDDPAHADLWAATE